MIDGRGNGKRAQKPQKGMIKERDTLVRRKQGKKPGRLTTNLHNLQKEKRVQPSRPKANVLMPEGDYKVQLKKASLTFQYQLETLKKKRESPGKKTD